MPCELIGAIFKREFLICPPILYIRDTMDDQVSQVKERLDILEVVGSYLTLKKAGSNYKANCPFHNEKTPSFMISPERQTFKCFGCGEGGDILTFIEKIEGVDFYNALKILADRAGIKLVNSIKYGNKQYSANAETKLFEINNWAKRVYHKIFIDHPKAEKAREYISKRGMSPGSVNNFEIGYAPKSWDFLIKFLSSKGYTREEMLKAGLVIKNEKGDFYDRFRGRIIFPINNIMGQTVGFTSRILEDDPNQAKYINSSESPIYRKGKILYALDKAKMAIKEADLAVMVEGNMDVIACHQSGFKNVVASSGTAVTPDQLKILARYASEVAFSFDHDVAGESAMKRTVTMAMQNDITVKIVSVPEQFKDPDEAIKADSKNWSDAVANSKPALEYWIDLLISKEEELTLSAKKKIAKEILPVVKTIYSDIEKEHYLKYLSKKISVSESSLLASLQKAKNIPESGLTSSEIGNETKALSLTERLIGILWSEPKLVVGIKNDLDVITYEKIDFDAYIEKARILIKDGKFNQENFLPDEVNKLNSLSIFVLKDFEPATYETLESEVEYLRESIKREKNEDLKNNFAKLIKEAEEKNDKQKLKELLSEFSKLIK